jgi:hypothetical protein
MKSMFPLTLAAIVGTMLITSTSLRAQDTNNSNGTFPAMGTETASNDQGELYRANELSLDAFGSGSLGKYSIDHLSGHRVRHDTQLGAGLGINYFFTRNIGIGADAYSENTTGSAVDSASANLILRLPLGKSGFAPYVFGGGGFHFDAIRTQFAQAGAGIEYRFCPHMGVFIDARGVLPEHTPDYGVARLGLRFVF